MAPRYALIEIDRKLHFAWVAERQGRRLRLVLEDGTAALEPARRVLYEWEGDPVAEDSWEGAVAQLRVRGPEAREAGGRWDWEALHARIGAGEAWPFGRIAAALLGEEAPGWPRAALYLALLGAEPHFRPSHGAFIARGELEMRQQAERAEALRAHHEWLGRVAEWRAKLERWVPGKPPALEAADPEVRTFLAQVESVLAFETRSPDWKALAPPLELLSHDWPGNRVRLKRWLEAAGVWRGWGAVWRLGAAVPERFDPELEARAAALAGATVEGAGRKDYRRVETYSFDAVGTQDFDDAVSILSMEGEAVEIAAHVADAARALAPGDPLFEEAARRGATLYTQDAIVPMLPEALSTDRFSLVAGQDREAVSFRFRIGPDGARLLAVESSLVRVSANLDYSRGEALIADHPAWGSLSVLCDRLGAERAARGAFVVQRPEVVIDISDPEHIRLTRVDRHDPVHRLVEEIAILVNGEAGLYCKRHRLPAFYRVQPRELYGEAGQLPAARFSLEGAEHAGVACERYVQVSSPIRRFADLVMQRQIAGHAADGSVTFRDRQELEGWMRAAEQRLTTFHQIERRLDDYWKRRYLAQHLGLEVQGLVRRNGGTLRPRVFLEDVLLEAEAHLAPSVSEGRRGRFRVIAADPDRETVEVVMIKEG